MNSFASPLNSITIDKTGYLFDCDELLSIFKNIPISKGWVYIYDMDESYSVRALINAINSFPKANTIKFAKSGIGYCKYCECYDFNSDFDYEEIKFKGIEVKNIIFEDYSFNWTHAINEVFADSGLAENLDTISFYKNRGRIDKSDIKEIFEKYEKKNGLKIIFDE